MRPACFLKSEGFSTFQKLLSKLGAQSPYPPNSFSHGIWKEQELINVPLLFFASIYLYMYALEHNIEYFLFDERDCVHWHKVFRLLFPSAHVTFLDVHAICFIVRKSLKIVLF